MVLLWILVGWCSFGAFYARDGMLVEHDGWRGGDVVLSWVLVFFCGAVVGPVGLLALAFCEPYEHRPPLTWKQTTIYPILTAVLIIATVTGIILLHDYGRHQQWWD